MATATTNPKPAAGFLELDTYSLRRLTARDWPIIRHLGDHTPADFFELPRTEPLFDDFVADLAGKTWSLPLLAFDNGEPIGFCFLSILQVKDLNAYLIALFTEPAKSGKALALYIRHAFWSYPLHRLYTQLPSSAMTAAHIGLLTSGGFEREGVLREHITTDGDPRDAVVLGILRDEFEAWCVETEPRLSLA
jgi:RimJ/RimL family protein N-acetyltransferase